MMVSGNLRKCNNQKFCKNKKRSIRIDDKFIVFTIRVTRSEYSAMFNLLIKILYALIERKTYKHFTNNQN